MKFQKYCSSVIFALILLGASIVRAQENTWREMPYYLKGYEKLYEKSPREAALEWFKDSRFGLFIHWGPATLYEQCEWAMYALKIPIEEYEKTARKFIGDKFKAKDYVDLAVAAQMKYINFVAKHHDGFALWDSKASDYNSKSYPAGRDFLKELSVECEKAGIALFVYYSFGLDWHHPYFLPHTMYDPARPHYKETPAQYKYKNPEDFKHYINFAKTQIMEICTNYGAIAGLWFDTVGGVYQFEEMFNVQEIYDMIHAIQPHALVVYKTGANGNEDFITGERHFGSLSNVFKSVGLPQKVQDAADRSWESNKEKPAELNTPIQNLGWGYHKNAKQKGTEEVWSLLEYCATANANLLINIGPYPDGRILDENVKVLTEIGQRIKKEGFPAINPNYMEIRNQAEQQIQKEKANQTAN